MNPRGIILEKSPYKNHPSNERDFYLNRDNPISWKIFKKEKRYTFQEEQL